jgi:homodimeric-type pyruvate dehydrogenase E1 component
MKNIAPTDAAALEAVETREWIDSIDYVIEQGDKGRTVRLLDALRARARQSGVREAFTSTTPYINTIAAGDEAPYPGDREVERRIKSLVRWNALATVVRANRESDGIGGHISTYASAATLYEVAFNHFFRGKDAGADADLIYFQGHASPGVYARAYLEGRITETHLRNFRHELRSEGGLSSYPHPWLMPEFWEFPTVSMGLGPLQAIYQARYARYLENRGLKPASDQKVWAFLGDGETDEPEALGSISLAAREKLDNLIFVINCNLQRLDGPVRGNGQIIQELEAVFRGAGWNVIKVLWGSEWDDLLAKDRDGLLVKRMQEVVDGEYQRYVVEDGAYLRKHFWGADPRLLEMVSHLSDSELKHLRVGGHDPIKVYNAYRAATTTKGMPTVILARTIKGYGLGEAGEGKNITHQQKKLNESDLKTFRDRFGVPIPDDAIADAPFYRPDEDSPEVTYVKARRKALGGFRAEARGGGAGDQAGDARHLRRVLRRQRSQGVHDDGVREDAGEDAARQGDRQARGANRPGRSAHVRHGVALPRRRHLLEHRPGLRAGGHGHAALLQGSERRTDPGRGHHRSRDRFRRGSRRARPTRRRASTRFRSSSTTRCSASSASATSFGRPPTRAAAGSCLVAPRGGRRSPAKDCSTRTATVTRSRCPCRRAVRTIRRMHTNSQ